MADVQPFRGLRYSVERIGDISSVISPPYDVISPQEQGLYHLKSPYNIVRLELGQGLSTDSPEINRYTRAGDTLGNWLKEGVLVREAVPAFYILQHRFVQQGCLRDRWGLVARVRLADQSTDRARAHEVVMESRIRDRLSLLYRCPANVSSVLGMVRQEPTGLMSMLTRLANKVPDLSAVDEQGVIHNMWVVTEVASCTQISDWFAGKVVYIADGHHRYETALAYRKKRMAAASMCTGDEAYNFVMITLTDVGDPGMLALSSHRLVCMPAPLNPVEFTEKISVFFDREYLEPADAAPSDRLESWLGVLKERGNKKGLAIGVYGLDKSRLCILTLRDSAKVRAMLPSDRSDEWKNLDVAVLHWVILRHMMGVDTPQKEEECVRYIQDEAEAISRVDSGEYQLAFLMNPVPLSSVLAVADAGDKMPPKSTYFYPKLPAGLVMHPLWDDEGQ